MKKSTKVGVTKPQGNGQAKAVEANGKQERKPGLKKAAVEKREAFFQKHGEAIKKLWKKVPTTKIPVELKIDKEDPGRHLTYYTLNRLGFLKTKVEQKLLEQEKQLHTETKPR